MRSTVYIATWASAMHDMADAHCNTAVATAHPDDHLPARMLCTAGALMHTASCVRSQMPACSATCNRHRGCGGRYTDALWTGRLTYRTG